MPTISNIGRGTAKAPYLAITIRSEHAFSDLGIHSANDGLPRRRTINPKRIVFTSYDVAIHPELALEVVGIEVRLEVGHKLKVAVPQDLRFEYELSAENARLQMSEATIGGADIARALLPSQFGPIAF